jgi:hypothetical protein
MGSKCCDCTTNWTMEYYYANLNAIPIGAITQSPSMEELASSFPGCSVNFNNGPTPYFGSITIATYVPLKRILISGPSSSCDCINSAGGKARRIDWSYLGTTVLTTRTRTSSPYNATVICAGTFPFNPGYTTYSVPVRFSQKYQFEVEIHKDIYEYTNDHKCGEECPGNSTVNPAPFNYESNTLNTLTQISQNYSFGS